MISSICAHLQTAEIGLEALGIGLFTLLACLQFTYVLGLVRFVNFVWFGLWPVPVWPVSECAVECCCSYLYYNMYMYVYVYVFWNSPPTDLGHAYCFIMVSLHSLVVLIF